MESSRVGVNTTTTDNNQWQDWPRQAFTADSDTSNMESILNPWNIVGPQHVQQSMKKKHVKKQH